MSDRPDLNVQHTHDSGPSSMAFTTPTEITDPVQRAEIELGLAAIRIGAATLAQSAIAIEQMAGAKAGVRRVIEVGDEDILRLDLQTAALAYAEAMGFRKP